MLKEGGFGCGLPTLQWVSIVSVSWAWSGVGRWELAALGMGRSRALSLEYFSGRVPIKLMHLFRRSSCSSCPLPRLLLFTAAVRAAFSVARSYSYGYLYRKSAPLPRFKAAKETSDTIIAPFLRRLPAHPFTAFSLTPARE